MVYLRKFLHLQSSERWLVVTIGLSYLAIWLGYRVLPFQTLYRLLIHLGQNKTIPIENEEGFTDQVVQAINRTNRNLIKDSTCLTQALTGQLLLNRHGIYTHLCIGVLKEDVGKLHAHAWLESNGRVVIGGPESEIERYTILPEINGIGL